MNQSQAIQSSMAEDARQQWKDSGLNQAVSLIHSIPAPDGRMYLSPMAEDLLVLGVMAHEDLSMDEASVSDIIAKINTYIRKAGMEIHQERGLIEVIARVGIRIGKLIWYAMRAATGNPQAKADLKELITTTKITKEEVVDFLLKVDVVTLHLLTEPIHFIEAVTGWKLWAATSPKLKGVERKIRNALAEIEHAVVGLAQDARAFLTVAINDIKRVFGFA